MILLVIKRFMLTLKIFRDKYEWLPCKMISADKLDYVTLLESERLFCYLIALS